MQMFVVFYPWILWQLEDAIGMMNKLLAKENNLESFQSPGVSQNISFIRSMTNRMGQKLTCFTKPHGCILY